MAATREPGSENNPAATAPLARKPAPCRRQALPLRLKNWKPNPKFKELIANEQELIRLQIDVALETNFRKTANGLGMSQEEAAERLANKNLGRPVFYMNRKVRTALRMQMLKKSNLYLSWGEAAGKPVLGLDDIPVRHCDAIVNGEIPVKE